MQEIWKDIKGYEGSYQVSNYGRIKSLDRFVLYSNGKKYHYKEKITKGQYSKGYYNFNLSLNGIETLKGVHVIVYETFVGSIPNNYEVNHIDENKSNNAVWNLNLLTHSENAKWGSCQKRRLKKTNNNSHIKKPVLQYTLEGEFVAEYESAAEASKQTGIDNSKICAVCNGNRKKAGGYVWKHKC